MAAMMGESTTLIGIPSRHAFSDGLLLHVEQDYICSIVRVHMCGKLFGIFGDCA